MNLYVGNPSGYSYKEWKGTFYPKDLPEKQMLRYYGERFRAVEINHTFHRMPKASDVQGWADAVSAGDFKFVLKAPKQITQRMRRLKDSGDLVSQLLEAAGALTEHQGPVLFQLPPNSKKDVPRLRAFLELLPSRSSAGVRVPASARGSTRRSSRAASAITTQPCVSPTTRATSKYPSRRPRIGAIYDCGGPNTETRS